MSPVFHLTETPLTRGTTLIEASAGTGKTYTITALYLRLLLEEGLEVREILVTTYTEAATAELRDRIRTRISSALGSIANGGADDESIAALLERCEADTAASRLERALRDFDQAAIHTIHGFCQRMLQERAFESAMPFDAELVADQEPLLQEIVDDFWRTHLGNAPAVFGALTVAAKLSPADLLSLLKGASARPMMRVIPESGPDIGELKVEVRSLYDRLCTTWESEAATIRSHLLGPPKWAKANHKVGKPHVLETWFGSLAACLCGNGAPVEEFHVLRELGQAQLERACLKNASAPQHSFFALCEQYTPLADRFGVGIKSSFLRWSRSEMSRRKAVRNVLSFDDLLTRFHGALSGPAGSSLTAALRARFRAALIDEFQDTDGVQEAIFQRVFCHQQGWLYFIGDPKQAIYGFRGADIFTYLSAADSAHQRHTLLTNRRSARALVEGINHLFGRVPDAFVFDGIRFDPVDAWGERDKTPLLIGDVCEPPLKIWAWEKPEQLRSREALRDLPRATAAAIAELLSRNARIGEEAVKPSHIAVLVAKHKQARLVQEALNAFRVPSVLLSDESVWHSREAQDLHTALAAIAEPSREDLIRAALATQMLGMTVSGLAALAESESEWEQVQLRFAHYRDRWSHAGFIQMFRTMLLEERVRARLLLLPDGDRRLTNMLHLGELLHRESTDGRQSPESLLRELSRRRNALGAVARDDDSLLRLERDDDAVKIITMHRSKGLEFDIVFCPFAWGDSGRKRADQPLVFHDPADGHRLTLDLRADAPDLHHTLMAREQLAEEVRLLYVTLTRAIHQVHFVWGRFARCEVSAAAWLLHRPPAGDADCVEALSAHMTELTAEQFAEDLRQLQSEAPESIEVTPLPDLNAPRYTPAQKEITEHIGHRRLGTRIDRAWGLSSFTSLVHGYESDRADTDGDHLAALDAVPLSTEQETGIHAFPGGRRAGTCLHALFEELHFDDLDGIEPLAEKKLTAFSFDPTEWLTVISDCVRQTLTLPLPGGFSLSELPRRACLSELEFYLPAGRLEPSALRRILGADESTLHFEPKQGWLKGVIDLVFQHEGRFYLADWKSNRLGSNTGAYTQAALDGTMKLRHYDLQLHLYTVALHRYLQCRLPGYNYEEHFGGVYYFFVRGIDPEEPSRGIYSCRPEADTIESMNQWLEGNL